MATPYDMLRFDAVASTQDVAASRIGSRPLLVVADRQTEGRGRHGRSWITADRAVAASLAFRPGGDPATWPRLALVAGLAAVDTVAAGPGGGDLDLRLKWPNDVLAGGAKVAGLLAEMHGEVVTIGIGVNLTWAEPVSGAAALFDFDPGPGEAVQFAERWAERVLRSQWDRSRYRELCATLDRDIVWDGGSGRAVDVRDDGALVVETSRGTVALTSGEVREVR